MLFSYCLDSGLTPWWSRVFILILRRFKASWVKMWRGLCPQTWSVTPLFARLATFLVNLAHSLQEQLESAGPGSKNASEHNLDVLSAKLIGLDIENMGRVQESRTKWDRSDSQAAHLPAPRVLYRKFQQDTREEMPQDVLYCGRLMQYLQEQRRKGLTWRRNVVSHEAGRTAQINIKINKAAEKKKTLVDK